jgi:hypothetical protein
MFRNVFLIDMTEHRGLEQSAISSVQAYAADYNPEIVDWFKLPHHVRPDIGIGGKVFSGLETGSQLWPQIRQRIAELSGNGFAGSVFHVISYDPYVLAEARKLNRPDLILRTGPLAVLLTKWRTSLPPSPAYGRTELYRPQVSSPMLPISEALELTKRVLKKYGHTSKQSALLQVQLRPLLVREDPRAKKNPLDRNSSRLVANIVTEGIRTGSIGQYDIENIPGTERIWLVEGQADTHQAKTAPPLPITQQAALVSETSQAFVEAQPPTETPTTHALPLAATERTVDLRHVEDKQYTERTIAALKGAGIYTPKPQRDALFNALRGCLPAGTEAKTLLKLKREIRAAAIEAQPEFLFWHPVTDKLVGLLLGARVLRNDANKPVGAGMFAKGSLVSGFDEPLEDRCEAFMLETAITRLGDVRENRKLPVAHALFWEDGKSDRDSVEERLEHVLMLLEGRVAETEEGVWYVKATQCEGV